LRIYGILLTMRKPFKIFTRKDKKIVMENFVSLSTLQAINYLLPILILPYLFRALGPEKFGLIAFAQAFVQYFMIITDYGFSLSATRQISLCRLKKDKVCRIFSSVMAVKFILAIASLLLLLLVIYFVPKFKKDWLVYALSFGAVLGNTLFPVWFFQGREKMVYITSINAIGGLIYAVCIFIFINGPDDYLYVPLLTSVFALLNGVIALFIAFRKFELKFILNGYADIQQEFIKGWNIFVSVVAINAYTATRIFAVGLLTNNTITGFYSIAERIANFIQTFPLDSLSQAVYPRINKIFAKSRHKAEVLMHKIQDSVTLVYFIILAAVFSISGLIVKIACGQNYPEVILALRLLLISVFFVVANAFRVQFLLVSGRPQLYSKLHIYAAIAGLPLIFILIGYFSYMGAAISTVIIEAGIVLFTIKLLKS